MLVAFIHLYVHLQHTHVWIVFRGALGRVFLSPAHHQIHHSTDPAHFNKNLGSCLALWDWIFGTLHMPAKEREKLQFGVAPAYADAHTINGEFLAPFGRSFGVMFRWLRRRPAQKHCGKPGSTASGLPLHGHGHQRTAGEPLHDEVFHGLPHRRRPADACGRRPFEQTVLGSEFHPIKSRKRREEWVRTFRGRWFKHRSELEAFLRGQEKSLLDLAPRPGRRHAKRESDAAKESYRYRLKELQDRSREQELNKLAKALVREQAEAMQPTLFEEFRKRRSCVCRRSRSRWPCCGRTWSEPVICSRRSGTSG